MPSFDVVNYSLRPSKSIQRQVVFEGLRKLQIDLKIENLAYVGLGSIWFTDFVLAHKLLNIDEMVSIECNEIGYARALFNTPYACVKVREGFTNDVLPQLASEQHMSNRPWVTWLDFDSEFKESIRDDLRYLIEKAPLNSAVVVTFNGHEMKYGKGPDRPERLRSLFGAVVPDDLSKNSCQEERMQESLADFALDFMKAAAADGSRPGGFIPAFRIVYRDQAPMITVGGFLPTVETVDAAEMAVGDDNWRGFPEQPVIAPHLTIKEAAVLQSQLPRANKLTRDAVKELGFDLDDRQIENFETYYRQYPAFAQVIS